MKLTLEQIEAYINGELNGDQVEEVKKALSEDMMCKMIYDYLVSGDDADYDESKSYPNLDDQSLVNSLSEQIKMGASQPLLHEGDSSVFASFLTAAHNNLSSGSSNELKTIEDLATAMFQSQIDQIDHIKNDVSKHLDSSEHLGFSTDS